MNYVVICVRGTSLGATVGCETWDDAIDKLKAMIEEDGRTIPADELATVEETGVFIQDNTQFHIGSIEE